MRLKMPWHKSKSNNTDMTQGKILPRVVSFALPLMAASVLQQVYALADAVLVRRLIGLTAFAAIGADGTLLWIFESMLMGLSHGFGAVFAAKFGAKAYADLGAAHKCGSIISMIFGALFALIMLFFGEALSRVLSVPQEIFQSAMEYLRAMALFLFAAALFNTAAAYLRAVGDSKTPLHAMLFSSVLNIGLDLLFMGVFRWGVFGAGIATALSQLSAFLLCAAQIRKYVYPGGNRRAHCGELLRMGIPSMLCDGVCSVGGGIVQRLVNSYGVATIAGVAAAKNYFNMLQLLSNGIEGSAATFAGQNTGAKNDARIRQGLKLFVGLDIAASCATAVPVMLFARPLIGFVAGYEDEMTLLKGIQALRWASVFLPSLYLLCTLRAFLQNMGHPTPAMGSGFCEMIVRVLCVAFLPALIGETSAFIAEELGWLLTMVYLIVCLFAVSRHKTVGQSCCL